MNTDSKLRRFIVLTNEFPFVLFVETLKDIDTKEFPTNFGSITVYTEIKKDSDLRAVIGLTNNLPDPIAYKIIEALANALPNNAMYFPVHFFTANDWQNYIDWQNVDTKPKPAITTHEFTITVNRITHELDIIYKDNLESSVEVYDGIINLSSIDISVPFPKALLKECVADVYEIIKVMSMNREPGTITKSKYMSVVQTGHETFNWCNLKKIEKDLRTVLTATKITIEE